MNIRRWVIPFSEVTMHDLPQVGGKNASLGEMTRHLTNAGVSVPDGFATTADAFHFFMQENHLNSKITDLLQGLDVDNISALQFAGKSIRELILSASLPAELVSAIQEAYDKLTQNNHISVAVRSSATAEDLPSASFAGQQETLLNVEGFDNVVCAVRQVYASLYNDRAIAYRVHQGFEHAGVGLSVGIQRMVRSDCGTSGVMFTLDTESGFRDVVFITAAYGLGECVVQGSVNPDEFYVYKPSLRNGKKSLLRRNLGTKREKMIYAAQGSAERVCIVPVEEYAQKHFCLTDEQVISLAKQALLIEQHYQRPMDIEWGIDGLTQELFILQARPETVKSNGDAQLLEQYEMKSTGDVLAVGRSIGQRIGSGVARLVQSLDEIDTVQDGDVLVADMTDPDWEPVMKRASAIVTNRGGRTCHAAIIARELGIPAVVGTGDGLSRIKEGEHITVSCAQGDEGYVYAGVLDFEIKKLALDNMPVLPVKMMLNVANPDRAFAFSAIPNDGIGLARLEFIISSMIGIHPRACLDYEKLSPELQKHITDKTAAYASPVEYYVERMREGISTLAAAFYPKPVILRLSDFKSNEYAHLMGGQEFEPNEENPMMGFRGAGRYISSTFHDCFALECEAVRRVRNEMGLDNLQIMIPFVRTISEADQVIDLLKKQSLVRGEKGLKIIMMCEIPSNALLADQFLERFDGFSIGSNDLTQLTLGLDRDSSLVAPQFDERNEAVLALIQMAIAACKKHDKYIGICGQGPSDHPDLAKWLIEHGIDSLSLNPDSVIKTIFYLAS